MMMVTKNIWIKIKKKHKKEQEEEGVLFELMVHATTVRVC
jgi:uncharacterized protein (UPF0335 family)